MASITTKFDIGATVYYIETLLYSDDTSTFSCTEEETTVSQINICCPDDKTTIISYVLADNKTKGENELFASVELMKTAFDTRLNTAIDAAAPV